MAWIQWMESFVEYPYHYRLLQDDPSVPHRHPDLVKWHARAAAFEQEFGKVYNIDNVPQDPYPKHLETPPSQSTTVHLLQRPPTSNTPRELQSTAPRKRSASPTWTDLNHRTKRPAQNQSGVTSTGTSTFAGIAQHVPTPALPLPRVGIAGPQNRTYRTVGTQTIDTYSKVTAEIQVSKKSSSRYRSGSAPPTFRAVPCEGKNTGNKTILNSEAPDFQTKLD